MSERPADKATRTQQHEIVIDAPIEAVWKAISEGEELTRWFVEEATVEPGVGGTITISWGGGEKSSGTGSKHGSRTGSCGSRACRSRWARRSTTGTTPMIDEYTIERRDGKTVLRLVNSGIPNSPEWDGFYNGTDTGWDSFFRTLRHYLEHHGGRPRTTIKVIGKLSGSPEEAWGRLVAAVKPQGAIVFEKAPDDSRSEHSRARRRVPRAHDVWRRSEPVRLYDVVAVRQDADRGRNDPREMAAVARAGAGGRGARRGLIEADKGAATKSAGRT